jgi:hypothetical protein
MEFVVTDSEAEALLLENNLIKRFRPRFNVLLRDDKSFPYIVIRRDTEWPQLAKHRGAAEPGNEYFGPFASAPPSTARSMPCSAPSRCAPAPTGCSRRAPALPAVPDQALHGALASAESTSRNTTRS